MSTLDPRSTSPLAHSSALTPAPTGRSAFANLPHRPHPRRPARAWLAPAFRRSRLFARSEPTPSTDHAPASRTVERVVAWMPAALALLVTIFYAGLVALWLLPSCITPVDLGALHWSSKVFYGACVLVAIALALAPWAALHRHHASDLDHAHALP